MREFLQGRDYDETIVLPDDLKSWLTQQQQIMMQSYFVINRQYNCNSNRKPQRLEQLESLGITIG